MPQTDVKVLVTDISWPDTSVEQAILSGAGVRLVLADSDRPERLAELAADASAIMTCFGTVSGSILAAAPQCLTVARYGVGLDNIDVRAATDLGMIVTNVTGYCTGEVADHTFALLLALHRGLPTSSRTDACRPYLRRLQGQSIGIVGYGGIGRAVAKRARAFGLRVLVWGRGAEVSPGVTRAHDLDELLRQSDMVSLHLPLTSETRHIVGRREIARMKPDAVLINTARGGLVDTEAVTTALEQGRLGGAGLDVTEPEPLPPDHPLRHHPNVVLSEHIAFSSDGSITELTTRTAHNVLTVLEGRIPSGVQNPEVLTKNNLRIRAARAL